jgi:hypothetical protein
MFGRWALALAVLAIAAIKSSGATYCIPEDSCWPKPNKEKAFIDSLSSLATAITRRNSTVFQRYTSPTPDENLLKMPLPGAGYVVLPAEEADIQKVDHLFFLLVS